MRRLGLLLAAALLIATCDQIPFSVPLPIVITHLHFTTPDTLQTRVFQKRVVDVDQYDNFSQYADFANQVALDSAMLRIRNPRAETATIQVFLSSDTTLASDSLDQATPLLAMALTGDTLQRLSGTGFLNHQGIQLLQEQLIPQGLFALYFLAESQEPGLDLWVDSLVLYVHLEGTR